MIARTIDHFLERLPMAKEGATGLARTIHDFVLSGGEQTRDAADLLHGTWLGHPLHPVLTDIVVGGWSLTGLFDLVALISRSERAQFAADASAAVGTAAALPTIVSGLADYSTIPRPAAPAGLLHAVLNAVGFTLFTLSLRARKRGQRSRGILLSTAGLAVAMASAYLGGHLVFDKRVGTNHARRATGPAEWTAVLSASELPDRTARRANIDGHAVLLYRHDDRLFAVGAVCPHAGGPLEQGQFKNGCVQCPWHDSVFDLRDGRVVHGPSTYALPNYEIRRHNGEIEVRVSASA